MKTGTLSHLRYPSQVETGGLAQLVERLFYTQHVGGSIPSVPTNLVITPHGTDDHPTVPERVST